MTQALPTTTAIAPWYGSNRILAKHVGEELAGCTWVGQWTITERSSRAQSNNSVAELLIINGPSNTALEAA